MENTTKDAPKGKGTFIPYGETVKGAIINALAEGKSVLQKDREGVDFSASLNTGTVYMGMNQLYLQQQRSDKDFKSPLFMTRDDVFDRGMTFKSKPGGQLGSVISYYANPLRYKSTEYPLLPDGSGPDKKQPPIHKKGEPKLDPETKEPLKGYDYNNVFNLDQIDPMQHNFRKNAKIDEQGKRVDGYVQTFDAVSFKEVELKNPFPETAKPGQVYTAQNESVHERLKAAMSDYFNSCFTGAKYEASKHPFSAEDIKTLLPEIKSEKSPIFQMVTDASLIAAGHTTKKERIEQMRENKTQQRSQEHAKGRGRS